MGLGKDYINTTIDNKPRQQWFKQTVTKHCRFIY